MFQITFFALAVVVSTSTAELVSISSQGNAHEEPARVRRAKGKKHAQELLAPMQAEDKRLKVEIEASRQTSEIMQQIAENFPSLTELQQTTKELLQSFNVCGMCHNFIRVGERHDGGYLMCPELLARNPVQGSYSLGVEGHDKFSYEIRELTGAPVYQFDCSVNETAQNCDECYFNKVCIKDESGHTHVFASNGKNIKHKKELKDATFWSMPEALTNTGNDDAPERSLILKMDIEGAEWDIFGALNESSPWINKFSQLAIEFHHLDWLPNHSKYLTAMRKLLNAGFKVAHLHGNNYGKMYETQGYSIPAVIEVTLLAQDKVRDSCLTHESHHRLDSVNRPGRKELPPASLPELPRE
jgi:hypothetical protein